MSDNPNRRAGIIYLKRNGQILDAKGNFSYNLGKPKKEAVVGADRVHGFKETPQVPYIEGEITDRKDMSLEDLVSGENETITLETGNGKTVVLKQAWYGAEGKAQTEEGNIEIRYEGMGADEF